MRYLPVILFHHLGTYVHVLIFIVAMLKVAKWLAPANESLVQGMHVVSAISHLIYSTTMV